MGGAEYGRGIAVMTGDTAVATGWIGCIDGLKPVYGYGWTYGVVATIGAAGVIYGVVAITGDVARG